jgi:hypothetical protein
MVERDCEILFMSFNCSTILHSGTDGIVPYVTPALTFRAAIRSNVAPPAGFVKKGAWTQGRIISPFAGGEAISIADLTRETNPIAVPAPLGWRRFFGWSIKQEIPAGSAIPAY